MSITDKIVPIIQQIAPVAKEAILNAIKSEITPGLIISLAKKMIKKIKGVFTTMSDIDTSITIEATAATTTESATTATDTTSNQIITNAVAATETVSDALSATAVTAINVAETSGTTSVTNWVTDEIARLRVEIKSTNKFSVAARDRIEIAALEAMSVVVLAEIKNLASKLKEKI
ncbi:hypothetical protein [Sporomusa sp.]|uniref:hypothetical protein n=1 Tax=Sporomusa sp. TaxID=2078658 RepID=UPI002B9F88CF|nr:hypothetical protein [Sporomusa sp.]HWR42784.1 hypothetical protein [Sporomusa sp.]